VMEKENLTENALKTGNLLIANLKEANLPHVVDVRGRGLMIGIELDMPYKDVRQQLLHEHHIFTGCAGTNVLRLLPPLCLTPSDADRFINSLAQVLK